MFHSAAAKILIFDLRPEAFLHVNHGLTRGAVILVPAGFAMVNHDKIQIDFGDRPELDMQPAAGGAGCVLATTSQLVT